MAGIHFARFGPLLKTLSKEEVSALEFDANRTTAAWKGHSTTLTKINRQVNQMQKDVEQLPAATLH